MLHPLQPRTVPAQPAGQPLPRPAAGARRRLPRGRRLGAAALVRGQRRAGGRAAPGVDPAGAGRLDRAVPLADRGGRGVAHPDGGGDVRHDPAQAARGQRPRRARPAAAADHRARWTSRVGSVTYTLALDEAGGVRSDLTVARLGDRPVPGRRQRRPRPRLPPAAGARRRQRADPRHHRRHLLHRAVGSAGPRPRPAAQLRRLLQRRAEVLPRQAGPHRRQSR